MHAALRAAIAVGAVALCMTVWTWLLVIAADYASRNER